MVNFVRFVVLLSMVLSIFGIICGFGLHEPMVVWISVGVMFQCGLLELFVRLCEDVAALKKVAEDRSYDVIDRLEKILRKKGE